MTLEELYISCCSQDHIGAHLPRLYALAKQCRHVTEFGTRQGHSTAGMLYAQPERLITYDVVRCEEVSLLEKLAGRTAFEFRLRNVWERKNLIAPTDMLFIDTIHEYRYLKREFELHSKMVRKWMVLHDTQTADAELGPAIEELLWDNEWEVEAHYEDCCGLTVLRRVA